MKRLIFAWLLLCCAAAGCTSDQKPPVDRKQVLNDLTHLVILPTYREANTRAVDLAASVDALCGTRTAANLETAREAWRAFRVPWKESEAFQLGPVVDLRVDRAVDFWPLRAADVEEVLAGTDTIDDAFIDGLGVTRKGMPVLEYLLFEPADALAALSAGDTESRRCVYARAVARDVAQQTQVLLSAWEPSEGNYAGTLIEGDQAAALTQIVSALLSHVQIVEGSRLAKPSGRQDGGVPQPASVEAPYASNALADLAACVDGVENVYLSRRGDADGLGLSDAVARVAPDLDPLIRSQIDELRTSIRAIPAPLATAVVEAGPAVETSFVAAKELLRLLSADMSVALGTTPTFSDNDGD